MAGLPRSSSTPMRNTLPPQELLDDLCSRFVLNVPKEDLESFERILFLVEQAHWFYEDNSVEQNSSLKSLSLREFTSLSILNSDIHFLFYLYHLGPYRKLLTSDLDHNVVMTGRGNAKQKVWKALQYRKPCVNICAALRPYIAHIDDIYKDFTSYKYRVPVTGSIILDESYERCLLVKGWKPGSSWSFPRGKKNKDEEDHTCAIREVLEETGFDVSKLLKMEDYVEVVIGQQRVRLYIIAGVKEDTVFAPLTKKEISEISWFRIDDLQPAGDDITSRGVNGLKLYMVAPFLISLKAWVSAHQPSSSQRSDMPAKGTCVWKAKNSSSGSTTSAENILHRAGSGTPTDTRPGKSFRNFRFDTALIFQAMETAFAAN
ncbi:hypothetical protein Taro_039158 [Colocasia esculenta]|uniref:Nudix hydrolase domain-containing protein n=1 Tax=Colocasia esculenta TaxID=4460 RepID=A0A843WEX6_COLES|nr:hypothetical protein [Colocasia esculenta]